MIRSLAVALAAALVASGSAAQTPPPPKLLVVISVDQLSGDLFDAYRPQFAGGFARLASGTVFPNAAPAEPGAGTLAAQLTRRWPDSRSVAVSGNAAFGRTQTANQNWFWDADRFRTNVMRAAEPGSVSRANAAIGAALAQPRPALQPTSFCQSKAQPCEAGGQLGRAAGDRQGLAASPELDGDTLALAAGLVDELQLGRRAAPDVLTIDLAATANVARAHGSAGEAMCLQLIELDREIGDFLSLLDSRGINYAVALDGTEAARVPILFWRAGAPAAMVERPVDAADVESTLAAMVGLPVTPGREHCLPEAAACPAH